MSLPPVPGMCEYCCDFTLVLYAWRADEWCRECALNHGADAELLDRAPVISNPLVFPEDWPKDGLGNTPYIIGWWIHPDWWLGDPNVRKELGKL